MTSHVEGAAKSWKDQFKDNWGIVLITLLISVAGAFFILGESVGTSEVDSLKQELETYKNIEELDLPALLSDLETVNDELRANLQLSNENAALKLENEALKSQVEELTVNNSELNDRVATLESRLEESENRLRALYQDEESFTLSESTSKVFGAYDVAVGVIDVEIESVSVIFENENYDMQAGQTLTTTLDSRTFYLLLNQINWPDSADFTMIIKEN